MLLIVIVLVENTQESPERALGYVSPLSVKDSQSGAQELTEGGSVYVC